VGITAALKSSLDMANVSKIIAPTIAAMPKTLALFIILNPIIEIL
jgi:hypothetical protein